MGKSRNSFFASGNSFEIHLKTGERYKGCLVGESDGFMEFGDVKVEEQVSHAWRSLSHYAMIAVDNIKTIYLLGTDEQENLTKFLS